MAGRVTLSALCCWLYYYIATYTKYNITLLFLLYRKVIDYVVKFRLSIRYGRDLFGYHRTPHGGCRIYIIYNIVFEFFTVWVVWQISGRLKPTTLTAWTNDNNTIKWTALNHYMYNVYLYTGIWYIYILSITFCSREPGSIYIYIYVVYYVFYKYYTRCAVYIILQYII